MQTIYFKKVCLYLAFLSLITSNAWSQSLRYFQSDHRYDYRIELLNLAMEATLKSHGPYSLDPHEEKITHARGLSYLEKGDIINIGFFATNKERESRFLPIKTPILRGLLGFRIFIIQRENIEPFSTITSLDQLRTEFKAGFGNQWADMAILEFNRIPVIGTAKYENLFKMLSKKRFDYFPRGINEAWKEVREKRQTHPDLTVEPGLAFYYPYPVYFFVSKKDGNLADRIQLGLEISLANGSFKQLFFNYHGRLIQQADLKNRKLFILKNPSLADNTPEPDTSWWMDLD